MPTTHPDAHYAITAMYSVIDDAWNLELDRVAGQRNLVTAVIPDEDPMQEPTMCFYAGHGDAEIPYEVIRWFMGQVEEQISASRGWMQLRPELVEVIYRLRQERSGYVDDDDFPNVLAEIRATVPETDLTAVLAAAFGRQLGGTTGDKA